MLVQTDCGTENGILAALQCFLSGETVAHSCSFAHANQHIQGWWSHSKRHFTAWAIDFLRNSLKLALGNHLLMGCVWFVFSDFLQLDLDKVKHEWNSHFIRQYRHCTVPGIPSELYYFSTLTDHFWLTLSADDVENVPDQRDYIKRHKLLRRLMMILSGLIFTTAQVVVITARITFIHVFIRSSNIWLSYILSRLYITCCFHATSVWMKTLIFLLWHLKVAVSCSLDVIISYNDNWSKFLKTIIL